MPQRFLLFLHWFFIVFHTTLILFNLFGWIFPRTRRLHFYSMVLLLFSWGVLGIWKGFGYCFLTDWHYEVLRSLGETDLPRSYIAYLVHTLSGWLPDASLVNTITLIITVVLLICSVYVNFFRKRN